MAKENEIITKIFLNDEQAKSKLKDLEDTIKSIRKERDKAFSDNNMPEVKRLNEDLKKTVKQMNDVKTSGDLINKTLNNLSTASFKDLNKTIKAINDELKSGRVERGSEDWKKLSKQLKKCREELYKVNQESRAASNGSFISKAANFLNKNWGTITQSIAGFATATQMVRGTIKAFADMQQEMQNVRKYTGQTTEEVEHMNEVFKQMDTRTSREELNQLAGSAGRLGITAEKDILEFVDAADKINVALGDDLGKGAVDSIGKLAMAFGEDDRMGLRGAMLATGSAVNELAQKSSTQAGYLVDFTARLAGVGVQAGLSQAQIMGWGSVLDENMQKEEMAATALSQIISTMATDSSKMAKVAGLDAKAFADLIKNDMNGALMQFFDAMKSKGGFTALAPMFADMGLDGARATSVLAVLANKIDDVRKNQETANGAYTQGTSVLEEFKVQNETVQAGLDKAKKRFHDLSVELGERLEPIGRYTISTMSVGIRVLNELIKFTTQHWRLLLSLTATIAAITAIYKAKTIATALASAATKVHNTIMAAGTAIHKAQVAVVLTLKAAYALLTGNITRAAAAMKVMRAASIANPYAALATVLATVVGGIIAVTMALKKNKEEMQRLKDEMDAAKKAAKDWKEVHEESGKQCAEEKTKVQALTNIIRSNRFSIEERKNAISALQKIVPGYHAEISKEGQLYNENTAAIDKYIKQLEAVATAQAYLKKMTELKEEQIDLESQYQMQDHHRKSMQAYLDKHPHLKETATVTTGNPYTGFTSQLVSTKQAAALAQQENKVAGINDQLKVNIGRQKELAKIMEAQQDKNPLITAALTNGDNKQTSSTGSAGSSSTTTTSSSFSSYVSEEQLKKQERERKKREAALKREQAKEKSEYNKELKEANNKQQAEINDLRAQYAMGEVIYTKFEQSITKAKVDGIQQRMDIMQKYGFQDTEEYNKLQAEKQEVLEESNKKLQDIQNKASIRDIEMAQHSAEEKLRVAFNTPGDKIYQNEMALNEALFQNDLEYLRKKQNLYDESSEDFYQIAVQIDELQKTHQLDLQQLSFDKLLELRKQFDKENIDEMEKAAMAELETIKAKLPEESKMTEEEYERMLQLLEDYYAKKKRTQQQEEADKKLNDAISGTSQNKQTDAAESSFKIAKAEAITELDKKNGGKAEAGNYFLSDIQMYQTTKEKLKEMYKDNASAHAEMCEAMAMAEGELAEGIASKMQMVMDAVGSIMNGMSSYYSAAADYEVQVTTNKYDKQIEAAGNNQAKVKKLEEKREKEIAKIKTKYAKKQAAMQVAMAIAQTAQNAIAAYGSVMQAVPFPANTVLAPVMAGVALAAGMLQVATIKKQQKAQEAGYYEGGFTGGHRYRREAGVVHEGEFVANHKAVGNQNILPFLQFLDQAQRNNTIGSLTHEDVSRQLGTAAAQQVVAPIVNVQTDNDELRQTITEMNSAIVRLNGTLEQGIEAPIYLGGNDGLMKRMRQYNRLRENV